ncbi:5-dehydro-2-deoxygluconokinase [Caulifigura coniformis]|uniref:5-dehydro-2-deoxygluconokinase n=1 Tax=Caulifigura coniformis TaxID=2527983 RepID=A0A517SAG7_9PLAN|nr:adenosine kinase [Caulifigura coniformis]QDT53118.1 5-dehydro-2-deoxygluconokinase [Caulifigura coniformis]
MSFDVYGVGNPLVDIQAHVPDELLSQLGYHKGIMTLVEQPAQRDILMALEGRTISRCAGGSAANTMQGIAQFGGKGVFAGKTGTDELGGFFRRDMQEAGLQFAVDPVDGQTGTSVILITDDAQRTMLTTLALAAQLEADDIDDSAIRQSKYVYIEGYLFGGEPTRSAAMRVIELAKKNGVKVAFTVSDPFLIQYFRDQFRELIEGPVDLLFCNLDEARALTGLHDPIECAQAIHEHAENVAMTLGAEGSILMHEGEVIPIEGVAVKAIDTTGAGDMYAAGILYGITNGLSWKQSGRLASHAAARVVSQLGARLANVISPAEIKQIIGT